MKKRLLWKLFLIIAVGTVALFWAIDLLTQHAEQKMSFINEEHQQQILAYGKEAERLYQQGDTLALETWINHIQQVEKTWAVVSVAHVKPMANGNLSKQFADNFRLGRNVKWMIHLYFKDNPIMDVPFADGATHFLIRLPQRMRPGAYFPHTHLALQIALPFIILCLLSFILYRQVMAPLEKLKQATQQFSAGHYNARVNKNNTSNRDELTQLTSSFDEMAERTSDLINNQRQLLADLSHEIRTPLARMDMAVDFVDQDINPKQALSRLRYELQAMRDLVEDTLTLVWLDNEKPRLDLDDFDLVELINVICDDARFEYANRNIVTELPAQALLKKSSQRSLGQALENIIRNALNHTPEHSSVLISLQAVSQQFIVSIKDHGQGVPVELLKDIFRPFFQVDHSRLAYENTKALNINNKRGGYGLGLALAQRQIAAVSGTVYAENHFKQSSKNIAGLQITVVLPNKT